MKLEEAQNRQANILDKLECLNKALKEAVDLGMVIEVNATTWKQGTSSIYHNHQKEYTSIDIFVGIRPSNVEL